VTAGLLLAGCTPGHVDGPFPTVSSRPGMKGTSWKNFAFAAPAEWTEEQGTESGDTYWKQAGGDIAMSGSPTGITECPKPGNSTGYGTAGTRLKESGQTVASVRSFHVPGAGGALRYHLTGGRLGDDVRLQVWTRDCREQAVLDIYATGEADRIADTLIVENG